MKIKRILLFLFLSSKIIFGSNITDVKNNQIKNIAEKFKKEKVDNEKIFILLNDLKNTVIKSKGNTNKEMIVNLINFYEKILKFLKNNSNNLSKIYKKEIIKQLKIIKNLILENTKTKSLNKKNVGGNFLIK